MQEEQIKRYQRQIAIPEIKSQGQKKINAASIFLAGAGGLGSVVIYYLAAAGVGKIGIIDNDFVELSNLNRQIIHNIKRIGMPKVISAKKTIETFNPNVKVVTYQERLSDENVIELIKDYDLVVDCTDNFFTRYLLNKACVSLLKPLFYGAVSCFEGQVMTIIPESGPCYQCLYPKMPANHTQQTGVIGVVTGLTGLIQTTEVIKHILHTGEQLTGELLIFNALTMEFFKVKVNKNPNCPICSKKNNL